MEPLTHLLTGACIGRAGFNRKSAYATVAAVLAAEAADLDIFWGFAGPVEQLKHHRGITHTLIAVPVVAAVTVGVVWMVYWLWIRGRGLPPLRQETGARMGRPTPHWAWLYLAALVAALSHILLDWTNNYGVRPFFPFNPHWYAGSFMFIAEPVLWAIFFIALFMPWVLGLAEGEIGVRRQAFRGRGWAIFALVAITLYGTWRWTERAIGLAMLKKTQVATAPVTRMALEPYPVNPYRWHAILETRNYYQTAELDTWDPSSLAAIVSDPHADVLFKPADTPAVEAAKRTLLGRVYLDWGTWAVLRDISKVAVPAMPPPQLPAARTWVTVTFNDLRFDYSFLGTRSATTRASGSNALSGWVYIVDGREEAGEGMGGRVQPVPAGD